MMMSCFGSVADLWASESHTRKRGTELGVTRGNLFFQLMFGGYGDFVQSLWSHAASSCTREVRALVVESTAVLVVRGVTTPEYLSYLLKACTDLSLRTSQWSSIYPAIRISLIRGWIDSERGAPDVVQ